MGPRIGEVWKASGIVLLAFLFFLWFLQSELFQSAIGGDLEDFGQICAGGRALQAGESPYNAASFDRHLAEVTPDHPMPFVRLFYPPWSISPLLLLVGARDCVSMRILWLGLSTIFLIGIGILTWIRCVGGTATTEGRTALLPVALTLVSYPALHGVANSSISPMIGFCAAAFLLLWSRKIDFGAGLLLPFLTAKPTLLLPFLLTVVLLSIVRKRWLVLLGAAASSGLLLMAIELRSNSTVRDWFAILPLAQENMRLLETASLVSLLRVFLGAEESGATILAAVLLGVLLACVNLMKGRGGVEDERILSNAILISVLCSPYTWIHDCVLMLILEQEVLARSYLAPLQRGRWMVIVFGVSIFTFVTASGLATTHTQLSWVPWVSAVVWLTFWRTMLGVVGVRKNDNGPAL